MAAHNRMLQINADNYKKSLQMLEEDKDKLDIKQCCDKVPFGKCVRGCPGEYDKNKGNRNQCEDDSNQWILFDIFAKANCADVHDKIKHTRSLIDKTMEMIRLEKEHKVSDLQDKYSSQTKIMKNKNETANTAKMLINHQDKVLNKNETNIEKLGGDLNMLKRKISIYENEYRTKSKYIFILKNVFISLLIIILLALLVNNNTISVNTAIYIGSIICGLIWLSILYYKLNN